MPPVTKAGGQQFRKDVEFVTKDNDEQVAAGIVMVPDKVDLQNDFAREETIRSFADQFETFVEAGEAGGGIMHTVFPDEWMDLERNEVLDEAEEIGGETVDAGAWIQQWRVNHADLWQLIRDDILSGYSIGAIQVDWNGPFEQDEVDDVEVPEKIDEDALIWELVEGIIREVSAVDIPAVPDAQILEAKAQEKRLGDYLGDPEGFLEEALERGHTEAEAEQLWEVLTEAAEEEGSGEPGEKGLFHRIGKAAFDAFLGGDPDPDESSGKSQTAETPDSDPRDDGVFKEGQTLSRKNRHSEMASIDASLDVLEDAGIEHGMTRFTDREAFDFDLSEHKAREWADPDEDEAEDGDEEEDEEDGKHAAGGDTPDDNDTTETDMSDDNPDGGDGATDAKDLAEQNAEQISELTNAVEELTETITGPEPKTAEIEIDGETYEVPESQVKAAFGVDEETDVADAIKALQEKAERVDDVEQRLDAMNQQSGVSTQLERTAESEENEEDGLDGLGKALS